MQTNNLTIKEYCPIAAGIAELKSKFGYVPTIDSIKECEKVKADYRAVRKVSIKLDKQRKDLGEEARTRLGLINSEAKAIEEELSLISQPLKDAVEEWEETQRAIEAARIQKITQQIEEIKAFTNVEGMTSEQISSIIEAVDTIECDAQFEEFRSDAEKAKSDTLARLANSLSIALSNERAEAERIAANIELEKQYVKTKIQERITKLMMIPTDCFNFTSDQVAQKINALASFQVTEQEFGERTIETEQIKLSVIENLKSLHSMKVEVEAKAKQDLAQQQANMQVETKQAEVKAPEAPEQVCEQVRLANALNSSFAKEFDTEEQINITPIVLWANNQLQHAIDSLPSGFESVHHTLTKLKNNLIAEQQQAG